MRPVIIAVLMAFCFSSTTVPAQAECTYVRAFYDGASIQPCPVVAGDFLIINSRVAVGGQTCENETFLDRYDAYRRSTCGGSDECVFYIQGNGLSGTYNVTNVDAGGCLTLCACTPLT